MQSYSATTEGITVTAQPVYLDGQSDSLQYKFVFAYIIVIRNDRDEEVQLLRRHWFIHDAGVAPRDVEGEGVVGQQPVLEPGQKHEYVSGCNLKSGIGKMLGTYLMERVVDGTHVRVNFPSFTMIAPLRLN